MTIKELAEILGPSIVRSVNHRRDREFIDTLFHYPNGDSVVLYLVRKDDADWITDLGATQWFLGYDRVRLTARNMDFVLRSCAWSDVTILDGVLSKRLSPDRIGQDVIDLCQTMVQVATLNYWVRQRRFGKHPRVKLLAN